MKNRNPLFVAGFPYVLLFVSYVALNIFSLFSDKSEDMTLVGLIFLLVIVSFIFVALFYFYYWLFSTANVLRRETKQDIPIGLLLFIPFANYWWMWRYSQAAEVYIKAKYPAPLLFVLIALLGSVGNGIMQDTFNKMPQK
jgi:hypothetical protein